jgi:hypothetical protein
MMRLPHVDYGANDARTPGYIWNSSTQELIPILPEGHPEHLRNAEIVADAWRRLNGRTKSRLTKRS